MQDMMRVITHSGEQVFISICTKLQTKVPLITLCYSIISDMFYVVTRTLAAAYVNLFNLHGVYNRIYRTSTESLFSLWRRRAPRIETGRNNRDIRATSVSVTCLIVLSASYNTTQCGSRLQCSRRRVTYSCI